MTTPEQPESEGVPGLEELSVGECMDYLAGAQVGQRGAGRGWGPGHFSCQLHP